MENMILYSGNEPLNFEAMSKMLIAVRSLLSERFELDQGKLLRKFLRLKFEVHRMYVLLQ